MSKIKDRDSAPEITVGQIARRSGFCFRLYRKDLHSRPELASPQYRAVVFVHGCGWRRSQAVDSPAHPRGTFWPWEAEKQARQLRRAWM